MSEQLILATDVPYFPAAGMNIDSNGVGTYENEATNIINMDVHSHDIRTRPGTITITPYLGVIPTEDVLHYDSFKYPTGEAVIFAFTESDIYRQDTTLGWISVITTGLFNGKTFNFWSTTPHVDDTLGVTLVAAGSWLNSATSTLEKGDERLLCYYDQTTAKFKTLPTYQNVPITDEQLLSLSDAPVSVPEISPQIYNSGVTFIAKNISKWEAGAIAGTPDETQVHLSVVVDYDGTAPATSLVPNIVVTMWTSVPALTTDISLATRAEVKIEVGYMVRGSTNIYVEAQDIEAAIKGHVLASQIVEVEEDSFGTELTEDVTAYFPAGDPGIINGDLAHRAPQTNYLELTPGTFQITLGTGDGTLASSGKAIHSLPVGRTTFGTLLGTAETDGSNVNCYRMIPTNESIVDFDNSWVRVDGLEWQLSFLRSPYGGAELIGYYRYKEVIGYNPVHITSFHNALVFGNLYDPIDDIYMPWRIQWSEIGDFDIFNYESYQDLILQKVGAITGFCVYNTVIDARAATFLYIAQQHTISRGTFDKDLFLNIDTAVPEGLEFIRTLSAADDLLYYMGINDFYAFDGLNRKSITTKEDTRDSRIREYIFSNLNVAEKAKNFSVYDAMQRTLLFFVMLNSNTGTYPTDVAVYNIDRKSWVLYTMPETSAGINVDINLPADTIFKGAELISGVTYPPQTITDHEALQAIDFDIYTYFVNEDGIYRTLNFSGLRVEQVKATTDLGNVKGLIFDEVLYFPADTTYWWSEDGDVWTEVDLVEHIHSMIEHNSLIYALLDTTIETWNGSAWSTLITLTDIHADIDSGINLYSDGVTLYMVVEQPPPLMPNGFTVYSSVDNGLNWSRIFYGRPATNTEIFKFNDRLFCYYRSTTDSALYLNGLTGGWDIVLYTKSCDYNEKVYFIEYLGTLFCSCRGENYPHGYLYSTVDGINWYLESDQINPVSVHHSMLISKNVLYIMGTDECYFGFDGQYLGVLDHSGFYEV